MGVPAGGQEERCLECELSSAAVAGDAARVRQLLDEGADAASPSECNTALGDAVRHNSLQVVALLLSAGADANRPDDVTEDPPLWTAVDQRNKAIAALLVEKGARPEAVSLPRLARQSDDPGAIRLAIAVGVEPDQAEPDTLRRALHEAATFGYVGNVQVLLEAGADIEPRDSWENTPLMLAERNHQIEVAELLRERPRRGAG